MVKYNLYMVSVNGSQTLKWGKSRMDAEIKAALEYTQARARLATEEEIVWQESMGGYVPVKPEGNEDDD